MPPGVIIVRDVLTITGLVTALFLLVRLAQSALLHGTLRRAIATDAESAAALMDRLEQRRARPSHDDRNGLVLVALGIALGGLGLLIADGSTRFILGAALFPLLVGGALLLRAWLVRRGAAPTEA